MIVVLLVTGCTFGNDQIVPEQFKDLKNLKVYSRDQKPDSIKFIRHQAFGNSNGVFIGKIQDIAVDSFGHVFIADNKLNNIIVFSSEGRFLKNLGRTGKGPGEFTSISSLHINDKKLFVYNENNRKVEVFSIDSLIYLKTIQLAVNKSDIRELSDTYSDRLYVRKGNTFLMKFDDPVFSRDIERWDKFKVKSFYSFLGVKGQVIPKNIFNHVSAIQIMVPFPGTGRAVGMHIKFYNKLLMVLSNDNYIYTAWTKNFLIKVYNPNGTYQRSFYYPYQRSSLTRKSAIESGTAELFLNGMSSMNIPDTWPALYNMLIDDQNRLWISTIVENKKVYQWWVLNKRGKLLARFILPRVKQIKVIKDGKVYVKEKNKKDIFQIVQYEIQML